jgi:hypothetical protein
MSNKPALIILNQECIADMFHPRDQMFWGHNPAHLGELNIQHDVVDEWVKCVLVKHLLRNYKEHTYKIVDIQMDNEFESVQTSTVSGGRQIILHPGRRKLKREFTVRYVGASEEWMINQREGEIPRSNVGRMHNFELSYENAEFKFYHDCYMAKRDVDLRVFPEPLPEFYDLVHFLHREPMTLPRDYTRMSVPQALVKLAEWHEIVNVRIANKKKAIRETGKGDRTEIGRVELTDVDGTFAWVYEKLNDKQALDYEGSVQYHCVDQYWPAVQSGGVSIVSAYNTKTNDRFTIELRHQVSLMEEPMYFRVKKIFNVEARQIRGIQNITPAAYLKTELESHATKFMQAVLPKPTYMSKEDEALLPRDSHGHIFWGSNAGKWFDI